MSDDDCKSSQVDYSKSNLSDLLLHDSWHAYEALFLCLNLDPLKSSVFTCIDSDNAPRVASVSDRCRMHGGVSFKGDPKLDTVYDLRGRQVAEPDELRRLAKDFERLCRMWRSKYEALADMHGSEFFINWAQSKRIDIPWLDWAEAQGKLSPEELPPQENLAPKKEGQMREIIAAFAKALGVEPSGAPHKDAKALLKVLAGKVEAPCTAQTLAKYLPKD